MGGCQVLVVTLLIVITGGLYVPIWFIRVRRTLASLETTTKPARYVPYAFLLLCLVALATAALEADPSWKVSGWSGHLLSLVWFLNIGSHIFLAFNVVEILYEYSEGELIPNLRMAQATTIIASIIYLQYLMNRIPAPAPLMHSSSAPNTCKGKQVYSTMVERPRSEKEFACAKSWKKFTILRVVVLACVSLIVGAAALTCISVYGCPDRLQGKQARLISASRNGNLEAVRLLLKKGVDVNATNILGFSALEVASSNGHLRVVRLLLDEGAEINAKSSMGTTPLIGASYNGHLEVVKLLLNRGADINAKDRLGETALMNACGEGRVKVVKLLLDKGAEINAKDRLGNTALRAASYKDHAEIVEFLKAHGAR